MKLFTIQPDKQIRTLTSNRSTAACGDECLNEHRFASLSHAMTIIEAWWRGHDEERPKKALSGVTPSYYARQLAWKSVTVNPDSNPLLLLKSGWTSAPLIEPFGR